MLLAPLATAAAYAQSVAQDIAQTATDDTGTMLGGGALAWVVVRELVGVIRQMATKKDEDKAPPPSENAAIAALAGRVEALETAQQRLDARADETTARLATQDERAAGLRRDIDGIRTDTAAHRASDRAEVADRLRSIADDVRALRS